MKGANPHLLEQSMVDILFKISNNEIFHRHSEIEIGLNVESNTLNSLQTNQFDLDINNQNNKNDITFDQQSQLRPRLDRQATDESQISYRSISNDQIRRSKILQRLPASPQRQRPRWR